MPQAHFPKGSLASMNQQKYQVQEKGNQEEKGGVQETLVK